VQDRGIPQKDAPARTYSGVSLNIVGKSDLGGGWNARGAINYITSFRFRQEWSESYLEAIGTEVHSVGFLNKNWSSYTFTVAAARLENFQSSEIQVTDPVTQATKFETNAVTIRKLPEVETTVVTIGDDPQVTQNLGTVYVKLIPVDKRKRDQFAVMADVRNNIMPQYQRLNLRTSVGPVNAFGGGVNAEIMYWIGGPDLNVLSKYSDTLLADLKGMKNLGVIDPDTNLITGKPELGVRIDRDKASDMGVRVQDIASTLNVLVGGLKITDYYEGGEQYEVHVRAEHEYRKDPQGIAQAQVPSGLRTVQLRDVVTMSPGAGPSSVNRIQRQRQVMFTANMAPGHSAQTVMDNLVAETKKLNMPPEYSAGFTGRSREQGRAFTNFMFAFLLSIIFMYLILAAQFESWIHPITILLALPLTVPFALFSIFVLNQSLNIFSALGLLVLFGFVDAARAFMCSLAFH